MQHDEGLEYLADAIGRARIVITATAVQEPWGPAFGPGLTVQG